MLNVRGVLRSYECAFLAALSIDCWLCKRNLRSGAESVDYKLEGVHDSDSVELEKSNVLLMGPTGSGRISILVYACASGVVHENL